MSDWFEMYCTTCVVGEALGAAPLSPSCWQRSVSRCRRVNQGVLGSLVRVSTIGRGAPQPSSYRACDERAVGDTVSPSLQVLQPQCNSVDLSRGSFLHSSATPVVACQTQPVAATQQTAFPSPSWSGDHPTPAVIDGTPSRVSCFYPRQARTGIQACSYAHGPADVGTRGSLCCEGCRWGEWPCARGADLERIGGQGVRPDMPRASAPACTLSSCWVWYVMYVRYVRCLPACILHRTAR